MGDLNHHMQQGRLIGLIMMGRVGDTYGGNQFVDVSVRAYLYRWRPKQRGVCGVPDVSF